MQRNCKLIVSTVLILTSLCAFAQEEVEYKDVILDGKPAKLNVATGEITLVKIDIKKDNVSHSSEMSSEVSDFHVVKENENLLEISKKYKVSLTELKRANNLETTLVDVGQRLRVRNLDRVVVGNSDDESNSETRNYSSKNNSGYHIVEKGNTLFSLAKQFDLSVEKLKSLNSLTTNLIYVGQKLRVIDYMVTNEYSSLEEWTVSSGDTLYSIALKNGTSVDAIKRLNNLSSNLIKVGQILKLK